MEKDVYESCRQREWLAALGSREAARSAYRAATWSEGPRKWVWGGKGKGPMAHEPREVSAFSSWRAWWAASRSLKCIVKV